MDHGEAMGVLSPAYFQSRSAILRWLNDLLGLSYTKIEQTASGVAACHVFDALFPGMLKLEKVNFSARRDYEYVVNYKVLQAAFSRIGIEKQIDVERLIKGKYQDNLEFIQWVKGFFDSHASEEALAYDGASRRRDLGKSVPPPSRPGAGRTPGTSSAAARAAALRENRRGAVNSSVSAQHTARTGPVKRPGSPKVRKAEYEAAKAEIVELQASVEEGDAEREFYFKKLRDVEIVIQEVEDSGVALSEPLETIKAILYETEENGAVEEGAEVEGNGGVLPDEDVAEEEYEEEPLEELTEPTAA